MQGEGSKSLTLSGTDTFAGSTTLNEGILILGANTTGTPVTSGPVGVGTLVLDGGTLESNGSVTIGNNIQLNAGPAIGGNGSATIGGINALNLSGVITGAGQITLNDSSTVTYSGTSSTTYTGLTTVVSGLLSLAKTPVLQQVITPLSALNGPVLISPSATATQAEVQEFTNTATSITLSQLNGVQFTIGSVSTSANGGTVVQGLLDLNSNQGQTGNLILSGGLVTTESGADTLNANASVIALANPIESIYTGTLQIATGSTSISPTHNLVVEAGASTFSVGTPDLAINGPIVQGSSTIGSILKFGNGVLLYGGRIPRTLTLEKRLLTKALCNSGKVEAAQSAAPWTSAAGAAVPRSMC